MAEQIMKSPGVTTRELDLSAPGRVRPQGIPAGIIGTAQKGPAFVPTVFATLNDFTNLFGLTEGKHFGAMAMAEWMRNARSGLFLRVLGVGDGNKADASTSITARAGFVVGSKMRDKDRNTGLGYDSLGETDGSADGPVKNPHAGSGTPDMVTLGSTTGVSAGTYVRKVTGAEEVSVAKVTAYSNKDLYDGVYILLEASSAESSSAVPQKRLIMISSQATGTGLAERKVVGKTITDGTVVLHDFSSILTGSNDTLHIADISTASSAANIAGTIAGVSPAYDAQSGGAPAGITMAVQNTDEVLFTNDHKGDVGNISIGTISSNVAATYIDITSSGKGVTTPGVQIVDGVAFEQTIVLGLAAPQNDSFILLTAPGGTTHKVAFHSGGSNNVSANVVINTTTQNTGQKCAGKLVDILDSDSDTTTTTLGDKDQAIQTCDLSGFTGLQITYTAASNQISLRQAGGTSTTDSPPSIAKTETNPAAPPGATYFLACDMFHATQAQDYLPLVGSKKRLLRGVMMFPSGVIPGLETNSDGAIASTELPSSAFGVYSQGSGAVDKDCGGTTGKLSGDIFKMVLNGFSNTSNYNAHLTGSMDPLSPIYFAKVFNTDPTKIQEKGHYLYAHYDVPVGLGDVNNDNDGVVLVRGKWRAAGNTFSGTSSSSFNGVGTTYQPNFDNWQQKFEHAFTPWITSQTLGSTRKKLFRFHMLDAGKIPSANQVKVSIANIQKSTDVNSLYGQFDVIIRLARDTDAKPVVLQQFSGVNLNPASDKYIARIIGDENTFFDFEKNDGKQKLTVTGLYPNNSQYVRVEVVDQVESGMMEPTALPIGFQGKHHLVLDGQALYDDTNAAYEPIFEPPLPFRQNVAIGSGVTKVVDSRFYWGTQYQDIQSITTADERNKSEKVISLVENLTKWYPTAGGAVAACWIGDNANAQPTSSGAEIQDSNTYNDNEFSLERVFVKTKLFKTSSSGLTSVNLARPVDPTMWHEAIYVRAGTTVPLMKDNNEYTSAENQLTPTNVATFDTSNPKDKKAANGWRYLDVQKDFGQAASKKFLKFTVPMQGGWNGLDIFDADKAAMADLSAFREMDTNTSATLGGPAGPTTAAFRKGLDILAEKSDVDCQILATPGMRNAGITDYAIDKTEDRFDALYIMDMPAYDHDNILVTSSTQETSVANTAQNLADRNLDTSFAATYFPDLIIQDGATSVKSPPSVAVIGALSLNDKLAHPWYAPAGFVRGALPSTVETAVKLNRPNMDVLYEADINPITSFPQTGESVVIFGQKTMLQAQSALDRVNVRRLLIDVRRKVRQVANTILFEPNRESTLQRFSGMVNPILGRIQAQQGLDRFKVVIDTTTTTQQDIENNTIRGKIFLQPTRSIEFISLDFVVTNAGAEI